MISNAIIFLFQTNCLFGLLNLFHYRFSSRGGLKEYLPKKGISHKILGLGPLAAQCYDIINKSPSTGDIQTSSSLSESISFTYLIMSNPAFKWPKEMVSTHEPRNTIQCLLRKLAR